MILSLDGLEILFLHSQIFDLGNRVVFNGFELSKEIIKVFWGDPGQDGGF